MDSPVGAHEARPTSNSSDTPVVMGNCDLMRLLYRNVPLKQPMEIVVEIEGQEVRGLEGPLMDTKIGQTYPIHTFNPLKTSRSIRLLRIFDACFQTRNIKAFFVEHDLESPSRSQYEALSYTWGSPIVGAEVDVPDTPWSVLICELPDVESDSIESGLRVSRISIQPNLADFLVAAVSQVQRAKAKLVLEYWIDALCIDQDNVAEKQVQIALMGDIYARAKRVRIWLGKDKRNWEMFKWMHEILLRSTC